MVDPIKADLKLSDTEFGLLNGLGFAIFYTTMGMPLGALVDRYSRKYMVAAGVACWSIMTVLCGFSSSYGQLLAARMGVAIGEASLAPAAGSALSDCFPRARLGRALSVFYLGSAGGGGIALLLGGALIAYIDGGGAAGMPGIGTLATWQIVFMIVGLSGLPIALAAVFLKEPARRGTAGYQAPPTWIEMSRNVADRRSFLIPFLGGTASFSTMSMVLLSWAPAFFSRTHGLDVASVGLMVGIATIAGIGGGVIFGARLSELLAARGHKDAPILGAALLLSIGGPSVVVATQVSDPRIAAAFLALGLFATSGPAGICIAAVQMITPNRLRGRMSAFYYLCTNSVGVTMGPLLPALLTDYAFQDELRLGDSMSIVVALIGIAGPLLLLRARRPFIRFSSASD